MSLRDFARQILGRQDARTRVLQQALLAGDWTAVADLVAALERSAALECDALLVGTKIDWGTPVYIVLWGRIDPVILLESIALVERRPVRASSYDSITMGDNSLDARIARRAIHEWRKAKIPERCGLQHRGECSGAIIGAHTIQKASLREMCASADASDNHVFTFQRNAAGDVSLQPCGINEATVLHSMCGNHDGTAFAAFEDGRFVNSEPQIRALHLKGLAQAGHEYATHTEGRAVLRSRVESHPQRLAYLNDAVQCTYIIAEELEKAVRRVDAGALLWWATWTGRGKPFAMILQSGIPPWIANPWGLIGDDPAYPSTFFIGVRHGRFVACVVAEAADSFVREFGARIDALQPTRRAYTLQRLAVASARNPVFDPGWVNRADEKERDRVLKLNQMHKLVEIPSWRSGPILTRMRVGSSPS